MKFNSILIPPTLQWSFDDGMAETKFATIEAIMRGERVSLEDSLIVPGTEALIRTMVAHCAMRVSVIGKLPVPMQSARYLSKSLSPSLRRVMEFSDRRGTTWKSIEKFFEPIHHELAEIDEEREALHYFHQLFWSTYKLISAYKRTSETFVSPERALACVDWLVENRKLSAESLARMARVKGLFSLFDRPVDVPSFVCTESQQVSFCERVSEMLEDAYLLEASKLRMFFGPEANLASIRRDLRGLMKVIAKSSRWARGLVKIGSVACALPNSASGASEIVSEVAAQSLTGRSPPRLFASSRDLYQEAPFLLKSLRIPYADPPNFMVSIGYHE